MKDLSTYQVHHGLRLLGMRRHFLPAQRYRYRYWHWSLHQSIPGAGSSTLHLQMSLCKQESKTRTHTQIYTDWEAPAIAHGRVCFPMLHVSCVRALQAMMPYTPRIPFSMKSRSNISCTCK